MNQEVIYQIAGYTLAVALLAYLSYRLYRTLTVLLLISLFVLGGISCYLIVNRTYLGHIVVNGINLQPFIVVLLVGVYVGLVAVPLFLIFNIRYQLPNGKHFSFIHFSREIKAKSIFKF